MLIAEGFDAIQIGTAAVDSCRTPRPGWVERGNGGIRMGVNAAPTTKKALIYSRAGGVGGAGGRQRMSIYLFWSISNDYSVLSMPLLIELSGNRTLFHRGKNVCFFKCGANAKLIVAGRAAFSFGASGSRGGYFNNGSRCLVLGTSIRDLAISGVADPSDAALPDVNFTAGFVLIMTHHACPASPPVATCDRPRRHNAARAERRSHF